jgi:predicted amidophosphoribosyltransferase
MLEIKPQPLTGPWKEGFALDFHTVSSQYVGDDEYGRAQFETIRSPVGETLYQLKYKRDKSVADELCGTAWDFARSRGWNPTLIVAVPPSRAGRSFQPVPLLATGMAALLGCSFCKNCLVKAKDTPELKSIYNYRQRLDLLKGAYEVATAKTRGQRVLLIDDLYRSGATLETATTFLLKEGEAQSVLALTFTRTRSNR